MALSFQTLYLVSCAILLSHAWLTRGLTSSTTPKRLPSVLTPHLSETLAESQVDCTVVSVSAWHPSGTVLLPFQSTAGDCTGSAHLQLLSLLQGPIDFLVQAAQNLEQTLLLGPQHCCVLLLPQSFLLCLQGEG